MPDFIGRPMAASPGCYFCNSHKMPEDPGVLDTGINIHMEGRVFICIPCVEHLANLSGLADRKTADTLREKNVELGKSNRKLAIELKSAIGQLSAQFELIAELKK